MSDWFYEGTVICDPISSLHSSMGYGAIQINAGSLMLKRTNFVAHHSSFFDFLLLLDIDRRHRKTGRKVSPLIIYDFYFFLPFSHMLNISRFSLIIKFAPFQSSFMMLLLRSSFIKSLIFVFPPEI